MTWIQLTCWSLREDLTELKSMHWVVNSILRIKNEEKVEPSLFRAVFYLKPTHSVKFMSSLLVVVLIGPEP